MSALTALSRCAPLALSVLLAAPGIGGAQELEVPVLELVPAAQAAALGGAQVLVRVDPDVLFVHPAALGGSSGVVGSVARFDRGATYVAVAGSTAWWGGTVGVGMRHLGHGLDPTLSTPATRSELRNSGPASAGETGVSVGYAREVFDLDVGASATVLELRRTGQRATGVMVDVGASVDVGPGRMALSVRHLGEDPELADTEVALPLEWALGAASDPRPVGPFDVLIAAQATRAGSEDFVAGGGVEVAWWPIVGRTFSARFGGTTTPEPESMSAFTAGAGFRGDRISIDWAWRAFEDDGGLHRLSVRWR